MAQSLPSVFQDGTATVASNGTVVTGQSTLWVNSILPGDFFGVHKGYSIRILSVDSNTQLTLANPWPGAAQTAAHYEIALQSDNARMLESSRQLLLKLQSGTLDSIAGLTGNNDDVVAFSTAGVFKTIPKSSFAIYNDGVWGVAPNQRILMHGTTAQRTGVTPSQGVIGSDDTLGKITLGDGSTAGGILMARDDQTTAALNTKADASATTAALATKADATSTQTSLDNRVRYDAAQAATLTQKAQARANLSIEWEQIGSEVNVGGINNVFFTFPSGYAEFEFRLRSINVSADNSYVGMRISFDGTNYQATGYLFSRISGRSTGTLDFATAANSVSMYMFFSLSGTIAARGEGIFRFTQGGDAGLTTLSGDATWFDNSGNQQIARMVNKFTNSDSKAVTVQVFTSSGNFTTGLIQLLGRR